MNLLGSNAKYGTSRVELSPARFVLPIDRESPTFPKGVGGLLPVGTVRMDDAVRMTYAFWSTGSALPEPTIVEPEPEPEPEVADEQPADELASAEEPVEDERTADELETEGAGPDAIADAANGDAAVADDIIDDAFSDDANDGDALYLDDDDDAIIAGDDVLSDDEIGGGDAETPKAPERLAPTAIEFAVLPEVAPRRRGSRGARRARPRGHPGEPPARAGGEPLAPWLRAPGDREGRLRRRRLGVHARRVQ
jgi:hypothetical protein